MRIVGGGSLGIYALGIGNGRGVAESFHHSFNSLNLVLGYFMELGISDTPSYSLFEKWYIKPRHG